MKLDNVEKMLQICGMSDWLGNEILPYADPWYRFFRTQKVLEKTGDIRTNSKLLDLGCHQGQFLKIMQNLFSLDCYGIDDWPENLNKTIHGHIISKTLQTGLSWIRSLTIYLPWK